jgi:hypothetical protein
MINLFNEKPISELFRINDQNLIQDLNRYVNIETVDSNGFSEIMAEKYKIKVPTIRIAETIVIPEMEGRSGDSFNPYYFADPNKIYQIAVITYSIPYIGDGELFCIQPSQFTFRSYSAWVDNNLLNFKIYTEYGNIDLSEEVKREVLNQAKSITDWIQSSLERLNLDCAAYNGNLKNRIKEDVDKRKADKNKLQGLSDDLNPFK